MALLISKIAVIDARTDQKRHLHEDPLYSEKFTVWCGLWYGGVIEPYCFRKQNGTAVNVTCHTADDTVGLLRERFSDWMISCRGFVNWPPRLCDLTPMDYFLWGYVKAEVYANKPQSLDHLEENICQIIGDKRN